MSNSSEKVSYAVLIKRRGNLEPVVILESSNFDECFKLWEELHNNWEICIKETKPFVLKTPVVTAFDPALIFEICVVPFSNNFSQQNGNPYVRRMKQEGFSKALEGYSNTGPDVLDGGYNPF